MFFLNASQLMPDINTFFYVCSVKGHFGEKKKSVQPGEIFVGKMV